MNLRYRETSLLSHTPRQSIKLDFVKTSLLAVFIKDLSEILHLQALLNSALPKYAGLHLVIFSLGFEPSTLASKIGILTSLVNTKKLAKIT